MKVPRQFLLGGGAAVLAITALASVVTNSDRSVRDADAARETIIEPHSSTPADLRIRAGENQIKLAPGKPDGYNLLAVGYAQKARETGDFDFNKKAEEALAKSFSVAPDNYDALKLRAKLLLTYHRFSEALAVAQRAQNLRPEDHDVYGALTDAFVELGDYERAIEAAQTMVDLRPDAASYSRVAYLRSLNGDTEGAIEAMDVAVKAADPRDPEGVAWYRVQLGEELARAGRAVEAEAQFDKALIIFPGHGMALAAKAHARAAAGDFEKAMEFYKRLSSHDALLAFGDIYTKLGRTVEAEKMYDSFEAAERDVATEENDMSHLVRFWADRGRNLDQALAIMQGERVTRSDIYTCDMLAWVLFRMGRIAEAKDAITQALRSGTRDPKINYHAGMIYNALGERKTAVKHLRLALKTKPAFDIINAQIAEATLNAITGARVSH